MLRSTRLIGLASALALSVFSTASLAMVVLSTPSLTGSVAVTNFGPADALPDTFNVNFFNLKGTVTAVALPSADYTVSGQGTATFTDTPGGGGQTTVEIPNAMITSPLMLFTGALKSTGITPGMYSGTFAPVAPGDPRILVNPSVDFTVKYDGQTSAQVLGILNKLVGSPPNPPVYKNLLGSGTLHVSGSLYTDGFDFSFTESDLKDWAGFGALLNTIDQMEGGDNGKIDGTFELSNVVITAVPEPAPLALIGLALASLAWARRRRS